MHTLTLLDFFFVIMFSNSYTTKISLSQSLQALSQPPPYTPRKRPRMRLHKILDALIVQKQRRTMGEVLQRTARRREEDEARACQVYRLDSQGLTKNYGSRKELPLALDSFEADGNFPPQIIVLTSESGSFSSGNGARNGRRCESTDTISTINTADDNVSIQTFESRVTSPRTSVSESSPPHLIAKEEEDSDSDYGDSIEDIWATELNRILFVEGCGEG